MGLPQTLPAGVYERVEIEKLKLKHIEMQNKAIAVDFDAGIRMHSAMYRSMQNLCRPP